MLLDLHKPMNLEFPRQLACAFRAGTIATSTLRKTDLSLLRGSRDGDINDQYRSKAGALRFLKNIILLPGCGQFVPSASFVMHYPGSDDLVGAVLTSEVSPGVGHTTQSASCRAIKATASAAH